MIYGREYLRKIINYGQPIVILRSCQGIATGNSMQSIRIFDLNRNKAPCGQNRQKKTV